MRSFAGPLRTIYGALHDRVERQRGHLFSWVPVCFGIGIGVYFSLTFEPGVEIYGVLTLSAMVAVAVFRRLREGPAVLLAALAIGLLGFCHMGLRSQFLAGPTLEFRYYGVVEGRVIATDRSASDRMRITLDQVRLDGVRNVPARVRLSVDGDVPKVGAQIMTTAHLLPPQGPVEPGGFDFRRHMFFQKIGASGYTTVPVLERAPASAPWLAALRARVSGHVRAALPERSAGVAAALVVGDRAHVDLDTLQNLRDSNLAHLLAISGLHMGLFTGVVFSLLRLALNLVSSLASVLAGQKDCRRWRVGGRFFLSFVVRGQHCNGTRLCHGGRDAGRGAFGPAGDLPACSFAGGANCVAASPRKFAEPRVSDEFCRHAGAGRVFCHAAELARVLAAAQLAAVGRRVGDLFSGCRSGHSPFWCGAFQHRLSLRADCEPFGGACYGLCCRTGSRFDSVPGGRGACERWLLGFGFGPRAYSGRGRLGVRLAGREGCGGYARNPCAGDLGLGWTLGVFVAGARALCRGGAGHVCALALESDRKATCPDLTGRGAGWCFDGTGARADTGQSARVCGAQLVGA